MRRIIWDASGSQAIKDLLRVVKDKLLVIQLPSDIKKEWRQGYHANAETLHPTATPVREENVEAVSSVLFLTVYFLYTGRPELEVLSGLSMDIDPANSTGM
ncbi:hypothetical protein INS49_006602 [Diaporthe citri]|uniref:uncharacterized protein n=1 Tax=Diaporthe citri TaxID=83186 RepID=UPI001C7FECF3|nr:uncharacterized protein INS49_006602 [Diaporthe citri]KAG6364996.1 hypothetical protein INS49_006602 [Diaporthe citri]